MRIAQRASTSLGKMGIPPLYHEHDLVGEAYWGSIPTGTTVNSYAASINAAERFSKADTDMLPLSTVIPAEAIQKAIFQYGNDPEQSGTDYREEVSGLRKSYLSTVDVEDTEEIQKAETAGSSNLMHVITDDGMTYLYKRPYPIQALLPVEANKGKTASWDIMGPFDFGSAFTGVEDQQFVESDMKTYTRTETVKFLYSVGRVTRAAQLAGLSQVPRRDPMAIRIDAAQDALRALRERLMLGVDRNLAQTSNTFQAAGENDYKGIYELVTANTTDPNYVSGAGVSTYDDIMVKLDESYNKMVIDAIQPNLALCDYKTFGVIRRGLTEYFRTEPVKTFTQGVSKISLVFPNEDALPLVPHPFLPMGSGSQGIFLLDTRLWARRSLWQDMFEELGKVNLSQMFVVSAAETLIDKSDVDGASSLMGGVIGLEIA